MYDNGHEVPLSRSEAKKPEISTKLSSEATFILKYVESFIFVVVVSVSLDFHWICRIDLCDVSNFSYISARVLNVDVNWENRLGFIQIGIIFFW